MAKVRLYFLKVNSDDLQIGREKPSICEDECSTCQRAWNYPEFSQVLKFLDGCGKDTVEEILGPLKQDTAYILEGTFKQIPKRDLQQTDS